MKFKTIHRSTAPFEVCLVLFLTNRTQYSHCCPILIKLFLMFVFVVVSLGRCCLYTCSYVYLFRVLFVSFNINSILVLSVVRFNVFFTLDPCPFFILAFFALSCCFCIVVCGCSVCKVYSCVFCSFH